MKSTDLNKLLQAIGGDKATKFEEILAELGQDTIIAFAKKLNNDSDGKITKTIFRQIAAGNFKAVKEYLQGLGTEQTTNVPKEDVTAKSIIEKSKGKPYDSVVYLWAKTAAEFKDELKMEHKTSKSGLDFYTLDMGVQVYRLPYFNLLSNKGKYNNEFVVDLNDVNSYIATFDITKDSVKKGKLYVERPAQFVEENGILKLKVKGLLSVRPVA
jgi:hypothetical protein